MSGLDERLHRGEPRSRGAKISARRRRFSSQHFSAPDLSRSVDVPPQETHRGRLFADVGMVEAGEQEVFPKVLDVSASNKFLTRRLKVR